MFDDALEAGFYMWSASMGFLATTFTFCPDGKKESPLVGAVVVAR